MDWPAMLTAIASMVTALGGIAGILINARLVAKRDAAERDARIAELEARLNAREPGGG